MPGDDSPLEVSAVLRDAVDRCGKVLSKKPPEEAELREALCWLKLAMDLAEPVFIVEGTAERNQLLVESMRMVEALMAPLKNLNPALTSWDRARDPKYAVALRSGRRGSQPSKTFDPAGVEKNFTTVKATLYERFKVPVFRPAEPSPATETSGVAQDAVDAAASEPPSARTAESESVSQRPPIADVPSGPAVGDFLLETSASEARRAPAYAPAPSRAAVSSDSGSENSSSRRRRRNRRAQSRYGHQEDDLDFFEQRFGAAQDALQKLQLGDNFRYPSDRAFKKHFPYCDFQKAMKTGGLPKFDGKVRGYPGFRSNFYNMVYVQREHYHPKLLALEYMVPEKIKQSLFHGLQNTLQDFGHRLTRLEEEFGGSERQVQYLVDLLDKARKRGSRLPYVELRELVREVRAHLDRTDATAGDAEMLVVLLKGLVPQHIKAQFRTRMKLLNKPATGNNFIWYLMNELTEEIKALETDPRRGPGNNEKETAAKELKDKAKDKSPKVLGKFYQTYQNPVSGSSGDEDLEGEGLRGTTMVGPGKGEWPLCKCCQTGNHGLHNCRKFFLVFTLKEKVAFAKQRKVCFKCLREEHDLSGCPFRNRPNCRFCDSAKHHYLLCPGGEESSATVQTAEGQVEPSGLGLENLGELISKRNVSTLQLVANIEGADGRMVPVNILPDTGSTHNILEKKAAIRAGLSGFDCTYRVTGHGGHVTEHQAICGEMTLVNPKDPAHRVRLKFYSYDNPCGNLFPENWNKLKAGWPHLKGLDIPAPVPDQPVEMILGCANLQLFEGLKPTSMKAAGDPVTRLTQLGWMVGGRTHPEPSPDEEGEARVVDAVVGGGQQSEVSKPIRFDRRIEMKSLSFLAEHQLRSACGQETCEREYQELRRSMQRVWDLETEEEVMK